ncbi:transcription repressor OFP12-like [Durio zibethinus]|uniref:Transcription repressor n=1 Tax=Durio zibethinus TaxID=66656 RepID=A0A6P6AY94_DURZI|nr:transcription repressor OFP12-like [Durio zibethinus]
MPSSSLGKNLNLCFTKMKFPLTSQSSSSSSPDDNSRLLPSSTATASSLLFKSYNSLYDSSFDYSTSNSFSSDPQPEPESQSEPDFATVFASQRFFFTSPGSSNSIIEPTPKSVATTPDSSETLVASSSSPTSTANQSSKDGCACDQPSHGHSSPSTTVKNSVAVTTFSPNPYMDFRRSMQEMVEARDLIEVKANWEYLRELLLCYLALNPKATHKFIIGAFADLLVSLMAAEGGGNDGNVTEITGGRIPG